MNADIVIVGAGPVGLCLAHALSGAGLRITLVEKQGRDALSEPAFDGREIALTHNTVALMKRWGLWERIEDVAKSRLVNAKVFNGASSRALQIGHELSDHQELGWLVANQLIRKAAFDVVEEGRASNRIELLTSEEVVGIENGRETIEASLASGRKLSARLLIAADSRFSLTRRMMGIGADMRDFGKSMLVCYMTHEKPHDHTAWEWFGYGQTLALLPMNPDPESGAFRSSVVVTLPGREIDRLQQVDAHEFNAEIERRFAHRLGGMKLVSTRHAYPLVAVYPRQFVARRFATVGDAAVGMHPVTAHGFNFGVSSIESLANAILSAHGAGKDFADDAVLKRYESRHRRSTRPLYLMTDVVTTLYNRDNLPAKLARNFMLHVGENLPLVKHAIAAHLAGSRKENRKEVAAR
ncbi:MAG: FAD-dependent hydroxylase [Paraburkholderia sp.]|uniref:5-demethoxyubiquinol-8 5-hydroxylase UbiM n=1 Tax=Paraburkholderia sp. TaxID=1926495 RepID=UPI0012151D02|nr:5-demethoxyubiquinol-8 5-hydroxylase UbiM [Paraburkholderia sp.]TAM00286.1 MAG: FAD-dependent hydroxylase [Paraburkholderia sp.]TAM31491.1 MAG: FAD-dependent hydroxylase [Paraburkholderia sp.]